MVGKEQNKTAVEMDIQMVRSTEGMNEDMLRLTVCGYWIVR